MKRNGRGCRNEILLIESFWWKDPPPASTYLSMSSDLNFLQLPYDLRNSIDNAFNSNLLEPPPKKRKLESDIQTTQDHLPFAQIPTALSILNLPPDDQQVLAVFRNAASGWSQPQQLDANMDGQMEQQGMVSRKDFQAICAALLESGSTPEIDTNISAGGGFLIEDTATSRRSTRFFGPHIDGEKSDFTPESEDEGYKDPYSEPEGETSTDEYVEGPSTRRSTRPRKSKSKFKLPSDSNDSEEDLITKPLSPHQQKDALLAFALIFPDVPSDLEKQRIMINDIDRVAKLLKEKLKAEEVSNSYNNRVRS